ncbi:MAG: RluA family pseudouridine synthase [Anaeroplasma sp.]|nr:RluA family pseudouridine synthase [Anaeroplasma sp.]
MRPNNKNNSFKKEPKMEYTACFKVNRSEELMSFLLNKCSTSRNNVKNLLTNHYILVNGSVATQHNLMLAKDDEVKISKRPIREEGKPKTKVTPKNRYYSINIIYEDDDFIAIDKPSGLLSVESDKDSICAYSYVLRYLQSKNKTLRPYVLHRIDKETSGVLVFAKNVKIHSMLRLNWNEYVKVREYMAVVEGKMDKKSDTIVSFLKENQNNLVYSTNDPSGQKAITHYHVVHENQNYSLLKVLIDTGRKNQIRVHMHDLNHPIVKDEKYGYTKNPLNRLGLHASRLEFIHPVTKELISLVAPTPRIFYGLFSK